MKGKDLVSLELIADKVKITIGDKPNYYQLERNTGVHRDIIKAICTGYRTYSIGQLIKLCNELKIDLLK